MVLSDVSNLGRYSKVLIDVRCDGCGCNKTLKYKSYTEYGYCDGVYFCRSCKLKSNNLEKYGVENVFQLDSVKDKSKKTNLEKYGCEFISQSASILEKKQKNCLEKYGETHHLKNKSIYDKLVKTNLSKYGVDNISKLDIIKNKKIETTIKNFGVSYISQHIGFKDILKNSYYLKYGVNSINEDEYFRKNNYIIANDIAYVKYIGKGISLFNCDKGHTFEIHQLNYHNRIKDLVGLCTICNPIGDSKSIKEKELYNYIESIYIGEIIQSYRDKLEIDIYLPDLKIGFEFNGLYWHSEKFKEKGYHIDKTNYFKDRGVRIIHIWEDDWTFKEDIIKSQILNLIGKSERIFSRKCLFKIVDVKEARHFLDRNHIQGFVNSKIKIGLYYSLAQNGVTNEELVCIMTFDQSEGRKKMEEGGYNLSRFCNKIGYNVVGGASKLLSNFIKTYKPTRIISYADKDWSVGKLYYTLGFDNISDSKPDYKYIVSDKRVHKSRYKKANLKIENVSITETQAMKNKNILRVYDCGKIKFELNL